MMDWLTENLTFGVVIAFVVGIFAGQLVNWLQYRYRMKKNPEKVVKRSSWEAVIGVMVAVVLVWIMVSTNSARTCALTLNSSLTVEITAGKMEREAFQNAITQSLSLPEDIQSLPQEDPRRVAATKPITDQYLAKSAEARKIREDNAGVRDAAQRACGQ
jgi:predicted PurR-regulated permease PerM